MNGWRRLQARILEAGALTLLALSMYHIWFRPASPVLLLWGAVALALALAGARMWLEVAWRIGDRRLAAALGTPAVLADWDYPEADWLLVLGMLRRSTEKGVFSRIVARLKYRAGMAEDRSVVILETALVFGRGDWWRWDRGYRLSGAAVMREPQGTALLLVQLRPRLVWFRWREREIFAGPQVTLSFPVPPGQEERAVRIARYLDRLRGR